MIAGLIHKMKTKNPKNPELPPRFSKNIIIILGAVGETINQFNDMFSELGGFGRIWYSHFR